MQLHAALDLPNPHEYRAFWCLALSAWLGVWRIDYFLAPSEERRCGWRKRYRTHRFRPQTLNQSDGEEVPVFVLKALKENPLGKIYQESVYVTGPSGEHLSGGNAWCSLLLGDLTPAGATDGETPVFQNPAMGGEYGEKISKAG